jgi:hypothetical protein
VPHKKANILGAGELDTRLCGRKMLKSSLKNTKSITAMDNVAVLNLKVQAFSIYNRFDGATRAGPDYRAQTFGPCWF